VPAVDRKCHYLCAESVAFKNARKRFLDQILGLLSRSTQSPGRSVQPVDVIAKRLRIKLALIDHFGRFDHAVARSPAVRRSGPAGAKNRHSAGVTAVPSRTVARPSHISVNEPRTARFTWSPPFGLSVDENLWARGAPSQTRCRHARYDRRLTVSTEVMGNRAG
jgi:hypothetical protein